jgi:DNA replication protein DnaC
MATFKSTLNSEQMEAFGILQKFLDRPGPDTFVLKGYAGTGKTFLMQHLAKWLESRQQEFCMLASTGRSSIPPAYARQGQKDLYSRRSFNVVQ